MFSLTKNRQENVKIKTGTKNASDPYPKSRRNPIRASPNIGEDTTMVVEESKNRSGNIESVCSSPVARTSRFSTPVRDNNSDCVNGPEYLPEPDLCSPISCTQTEPPEVEWDCRTPKRPSLFQKKRTAKSNSPLLLKSLKRKLVKTDEVEKIELIADLQRLKDQWNNHQTRRQNDADERLLSSERNETEEQWNSSAFEELQTQKMSELRVEVKTDKSPATKDSAETAGSLEDLFDDSIDDCMIMCSQQVEEEYNLENSGTHGMSSGNSFGDSEKKSCTIEELDCQYGTAMESVNKSSANRCTRTVSAGKRQNDETISKDSSKKTERNEMELCLNNNTKERSKNPAPNKNTKTVNREEPPSQIPEDSFDDLLHDLDDDFMFDENLERMVSSGNQLHNHSENIRPMAQQNFTATHPSTIVTKTSVPSSVNHDNKINAKLRANTNNKNAGLSVKMNSNSNVINAAHSSSENRKLFKQKSLSDSSFSSSNSNSSIFNFASTMAKSSSNLNLNSKVQSVPSDRLLASTELSQPSFSSNRKTGTNIGGSHWPKSTVTNAKLMKRTDSVRLTTTNIQRFDVLSSSSDRSSHTSNTQCTAEEIERKRMEARMKLEANRKKKLLNSKTLNVSLALNKPIKR